MKIIKELLNNYFSQLGLLEMIVYFIAFGCIFGLSIAVSIYTLWMKNSYFPAGQKEDHQQTINPLNPGTGEVPPEDREEVGEPVNFNDEHSRKCRNEMFPPAQKKNDHPHMGSRRR